MLQIHRVASKAACSSVIVAEVNSSGKHPSADCIRDRKDSNRTMGEACRSNSRCFQHIPDEILSSNILMYVDLATLVR